MDLTIFRNVNSIELAIYKKPTSADITIHYTSNHPWEHKKAAYTYHINRALTLPITEQARAQEWVNISSMAKANGFPIKLVQEMKDREIEKLTRQDNDKHERHKKGNSKKWAIFTYHSPMIRKVTSLFKGTDIRIAFRTTNTIQQQLAHKTSDKNPSGIYEIKCSTCQKKYVGQSGRPITVRHKEHIQYIKNCNPISAYAAHILENRHEFGTAEDTLQLIRPCRKGSRMNQWENLYIQTYRQQGKLIDEQQVSEENPLYRQALPPSGRS